MRRAGKQTEQSGLAATHTASAASLVRSASAAADGTTFPRRRAQHQPLMNLRKTEPTPSVAFRRRIEAKMSTAAGDDTSVLMLIDNPAS
jgi:hypothetical protein